MSGGKWEWIEALFWGFVTLCIILGAEVLARLTWR